MNLSTGRYGLPREPALYERGECALPHLVTIERAIRVDSKSERVREE